MKHTYFNIPGWFNYSESYDVIVDKIPDDGVIVEIGSFLGRSTHYLATSLFNANKFDVKIFCIDTFEGSSEHANIKLPKDFLFMFKENLKFFTGRDMVIPIQSRSDNPDTLALFEKESVDYIMVDGAHEYDAVKEDIVNWWPKLKSTGVMFGDDYSLKAVEVAVKEGLAECKHRAYGVNKGFEQTWYCAKDGENINLEKQIPGVNTLI